MRWRGKGSSHRARRRQIAREVDEELRYHVDRRTDDLIASGMSGREARAAAERRFGDIGSLEAACVHERARRRYRRRASEMALDAAAGAVRTVRTLARTPSLSLLAVAILAVGIGATTGVFSVVQRMVLQPIPGAVTHDLYHVESLRPSGTLPVAPPTYLSWRQRGGRFGPPVAYSLHEYAFLGETGGFQSLGAAVSPDFFELLGVDVDGPGLQAADDAAADGDGIVLSHRLWTTRFAGDPGLVGTEVRVEHHRLGRQRLRVVGVAPAGFRYPYDVDFWVPLAPHIDGDRESHGNYFLGVIVRLDAPDRLDAAVAELDALSPDEEMDFAATPLNAHLNADHRRPLALLLVAVGSVLLIACANVGSLLLTRGLQRGHELRIRGALGAGRARLAGLFLAESAVLALGGGGLGVLLAVVSVDVAAKLGAAVIPDLEALAVDRGVLAFAVGAAAVAALVASAAPALRFLGAGHGSLGAGFAAGKRATRRRGARDVLVVAQLALTMILLCGSLVVVQSLRNTFAVDPGFEPAGRVAFDLGGLLRSVYGEPETQRAFVRGVLDELEREGLVEEAAFTRNLPMNGTGGMSAPIKWEDESIESRPGGAQKETVSAGYFALMGIDIVRGRGFGPEDRDDGPPVAVVNETFVRRHLPDGVDPLGLRVRTLFGRGYRAIVGVVRDVKRRDLTEVSQPTVYTLFGQDPWPTGTIVVRSAAPTDLVVGRVRAVLTRMAPEQPIHEIVTLDDYLARSVARPYYLSLVLTAFAVVAVVIALGGVYAVVAAAVSERRREIGIRVALGARTYQIGAQVIAGVAVTAAIGIGLGIGGILAGRPALDGLLFGVSPTDPRALVAGAVVLGAAALLAAARPALRAGRTDPGEVLRADG